MLLLQALWVLGFLDATELIETGVKGLEIGMDSPSLRLLASLSPNEASDAPNLFSQTLKELGFSELGLPEAARVYTFEISRQIINSELSPENGAKKLWEVSIRVNDPDFNDLDTFIYAASELQSRPEDREFFIREIVKEAKTWLQKMMLQKMISG